VEPPSWLPDGAAGSDANGPASHDAAAGGPDSDALDGQGPVTFGQAGFSLGRPEPGSAELDSNQPADGGLGIQSPVSLSAAGDPSGQDDADVNDYPYAGETLHSNGRDAAFGPEVVSVGTYGQESSYPGAAGNPPYPAQFGEAATAASASPAAAESTGDTGRRAAAFSAIQRPKTGTGRGRRADLVVARLEPWSVMKFSFLISLVAWVLLFVAVAVLYFALSALGVFDSVQRTLESVTSSSGSAGDSMSKWFSASRILGYTMLIGAVNIILLTAFATVGSMIYNLVTALGGGIEVTLKETD
jgi:hypothetical protein